MPMPASVCSSTLCPCATTSRTDEGVSPTRYSWTLISFGTPTSIFFSLFLALHTKRSGIVRGFQRHRRRVPVAGEVDLPAAGVEPLLRQRRVARIDDAQRNRTADHVPERGRGDEAGGSAVAQDQFAAPQVCVWGVDDERDHAPRRRASFQLGELRLALEPARLVERHRE